jgi:hypothetical protein
MRKNDGQVFYVGIGSYERPRSKNGRNQFWKNYVRKYGEYEVKILKSGIHNETAKMLERGLICIFKRFKDGGSLVNITKGGDSNPMEYPESVEKLRQKMKGRKFSPETLDKMSKAKKGREMPDYLRKAACAPKPKSHMKLPEYREMARDRFKGKPRSDKHKEKNGINHSKGVAAYKNGELVKTFSSQRQAAKWAGCTPALIGMAVSGHCKTAKGFEFTRNRQKTNLIALTITKQCQD